VIRIARAEGAYVILTVTAKHARLSPSTHGLCEIVFSTGPADRIRVDGQVVGQPSGRLANRDRRTEETEVPQTHHVDTASTAGRLQRNDQPLYRRRSHAQTSLQYYG